LVNGGEQWTYFRPKTNPTEPDPAIFGLKTAHFRAKWDAQKSVNYVWAAEINDARLVAAAQTHAAKKTTHIVTYSGFTKQTQFSPDIKEVRRIERTSLHSGAS